MFHHSRLEEIAASSSRASSTQNMQFSVELSPSRHVFMERHLPEERRKHHGHESDLKFQRSRAGTLKFSVARFGAEPNRRHWFRL